MLYCYRLGDGNEGNYPRFLVDIPDGIDPYAALCALVVDRYIARSSTRRHIMREIQTDGEPEYGIDATVYEGPKGEQAFGAAWITAAFEPYSEEDAARTNMQRIVFGPGRVDAAAWRYYRKLAARGF